ncbi:MAG: 5'-methylthioadenosine/S-adenosylhomocysteine nucleosidase [Victivallaceae bacterium]|nr:5'-methylthioadenosine/S-adenosylhomocysteine nucleosidase [Victivallaceae bacterium]
MALLQVVFIIAMDIEADAVIRHMSSVTEIREYGFRVVRGAISGKATAVVVCGIGRDNASAATQYAVSTLGAARIVNVGVAGGLLSDMAVGSIYCVDNAVEYDFDLAQLNGTKVGVLNERRERDLPLAVVPGYANARLGTGDRFNDSPVDHRFLVEDVKAKLRDMEGAAIVHSALRCNVPVYSFKSVSDVYGSGSTAEQYKQNLTVAVGNLSAAVPDIFDKVSR